MEDTYLRCLLHRWLACLAIVLFCQPMLAQNFERYRPLDPSRLQNAVPSVPDQPLPEQNQDDRALVGRLDAIILVDAAGKLSSDAATDELDGLHVKFDDLESVAYSLGIQRIAERHLGKPLSLRSINVLARDIARYYKDRGQPIVDVQIPEQRITGGTLQMVIVETRIGRVMIQPGSVFAPAELDRWIQDTYPGDKVYEDKLKTDLFWLNQNPFRRVNVDFKPGEQAGTTDVWYTSRDVAPIRGYMGMDDTGVKSLNYGRIYAGAMYGNLFGRGGQLSYQYTTDQEFHYLEAHSVSSTLPLSRESSLMGYGSFATSSPMLSGGLSQNGQSWQAGTAWIQHLVRSSEHNLNLTAGLDFKSTNNNLEFAGSTVSASNADLVQLRFGFDDFQRQDINQYSLLRADLYVGPGGGMTGAHSAAAFNTIRPGASPDYVYARMIAEDTSLIGDDWMLLSRFTGQMASSRLLFSETLGLGGYDTLRGFDQRAYNGDSGWITNFEFGPKTLRWGTDTTPHALRPYTFMDIGNGYVLNPQPSEDSYTFAMTSGVGFRYNLSDRLTARLDWGYAWQDISNSERSNRLHMGITWIPGRRP